MIHAREDYNRIQDPALFDASLLGKGSRPIGPDEPVFLLRAGDEYFVPMLQVYSVMVRDGNCEDVAVSTDKQVLAGRAWQREVGTKKPDIPAEAGVDAVNNKE